MITNHVILLINNLNKNYMTILNDFNTILGAIEVIINEANPLKIWINNQLLIKEKICQTSLILRYKIYTMKLGCIIFEYIRLYEKFVYYLQLPILIKVFIIIAYDYLLILQFNYLIINRQMSASYEFSIEIIEQSEEVPTNHKPNDSKIYQAIQQKNDESFHRVIKLQQLLKMQNLLLEYQEKKKNDRIKEIQYHYMNAYTNYLWTKFTQEKKQQFIFLNHKDLITINDQLPNQLQILLQRLISPQKLGIKNDAKPSIAFISDFMNFWPLWHHRIEEIIQLQVNSCDKIQSSFESQYTFAAKILSNLRLNDRVQRFCAQIFQPVLLELQIINEELIVDFSGLYDKWNDQLAKLTNLKRFIEGGDPDIRVLKPEIQELFGKLRGEQQAKILSEQMVHFERKQSPISFLLAEVGQEEIPEGLNLRLAWLVWKKILSNRKKLEHLATGLLASIIQSFPSIPHQIKYVVRCFKELAQKKFGPIRFQDLKSFFNKVVFSQLFFAEFMSLYQMRAQHASNNTNLTLLALISQKIMFGQQFYQKFKFGFLNQIITHYIATIKQFIKGFVSSSIHQPPIKFMHHALLSFQSVKFIHQSIQNKVSLPHISQYICRVTHHNIANKSYPLKNIFVYLSQKIGVNYNLILKSANKIRRTFTEFLILIDKISQKNNMVRLLEQYRCSEEDVQGNRPSVQLYSIYLSEIMKEVDWIKVINQIEADIASNKQQIERIKIGLEKEFNYSTNLEKMYMNLLSVRRARLSKNKIETQISKMLNSQFGFDYDIVDGKVCESQGSTSSKTFRACLHDICEGFLKGYEGVQGLYHNLCEKVVEELQKGVVPDNLVQNAKSILGEKMYQIMKLDTFMNEKDLKMLKQMEKHSFITPQMLDLQNFQAEVQIIVNQSLKLINQLYRPLCPDRILKIFYEITLIFQNVILTTGSGTDITADIQIPLMLITIIRCKVRNITTLIEFVEKFCPDDINSTVLGQTLTLLKSAIYLIEEMDNKKLSISEDEYQSFVVNSSYIIID